MAKSSGLGDRLLINGLDVSGEIGSIQTIGVTVGEQNVTGIDKSAQERLQLLSDGQITFTNFFTDAAGGVQENFHADQSALSVVTYFRGTTTGNYGAGMPAAQFSAQYQRGSDGSLLGTVDCKGDAGVAVEWGEILDFAGTSASNGPTNGSAYDLGAAHGLTAMAFYVQVYAFSGTSATLLIQDDDNSGFSSATTYGTFGSITGVGAQRLQVNDAPERYLRFSVSGTYTSLTFAILLVRL